MPPRSPSSSPPAISMFPWNQMMSSSSRGRSQAAQLVKASRDPSSGSSSSSSSGSSEVDGVVPVPAFQVTVLYPVVDDASDVVGFVVSSFDSKPSVVSKGSSVVGASVGDTPPPPPPPPP